jgi:hypothetical protein
MPVREGNLCSSRRPGGAHFRSFALSRHQDVRQRYCRSSIVIVGIGLFVHMMK